MRNIFLIIIMACLAAFPFDVKGYIAKPSKLTSTITWEITDDGVLRIYGSGEMPDFDKFEKLEHWRQKKYFPAKIKRVEIGEGITKIGKAAFKYLSYKHKEKLHKIPVTLPTSLKRIEMWGLANLELTDSRLPDNLEYIGYSAFEESIFPGGRVVVPNSVVEMSISCFAYTNINQIEIEGVPKFNDMTFGGIKHDLQIVINNPSFNLSPLAKKGIFQSGGMTTFVLPAGMDVPNVLKEDESKYRIISPETIAQQEAEKNVNGYISHRLAPWEKYIASQKLPYIPTESEAKADIERRISEWQKKGEYESTSQWRVRVNNKSRSEKLRNLTADWNEKVKKAKRQYNNAVKEWIEKYDREYKRLRKEFYVGLAKEAIEDYGSDTYSIIGPYDADNETFLIHSERHGDILLPVPRSVAPGFKDNWYSVVKRIDFAFIPESDTSVGLSRIIFPYNGKEYSYDGNAKTVYNVKDVSYNFTPLEVTGLRFDDVKLKDIEQPTLPIKTLTAQTSSNELPKKKSLADVDKNIPSGNVKRENTFAFLISNENYSRTDPVVFAINDGNMMKQYCVKTLGIPEKNVTHITDASLNDMRYQLKRISDICEAYEGNVSIIVYYAGHGVPEEGNSDAYLLPVDGYAENVKTGLSLKEVVETLSMAPACQVTFFIDACFSGTGREGKALYASRGVALKPKPVSPKGNLIVFSASQGVESAQPYEEKSHGLFTYYLLRKLKDTAGNVSLGDLADYLINNVKRTSVVGGKIQTPTVKASPSIEDWRSSNL